MTPPWKISFLPEGKQVLIKETFTLGKPDYMPANLLEEMLFKIKSSIPEPMIGRQLLFKAKFILTELLTNAIKHAGSNNVKLQLEITGEYVRFIKTDDGKPLKLSGPLSPKFKNARVITNDAMHILYAMERNGQLHFYCQDNDRPIINAEQNLPEHFGLLIITKAADEFYYTYNPQNNINCFTATINF